MYDPNEVCRVCGGKYPNPIYCPDCGMDISPHHNCHGSDYRVLHVCRKPYYDLLNRHLRWDEEDGRMRNFGFRQGSW